MKSVSFRLDIEAERILNKHLKNTNKSVGDYIKAETIKVLDGLRQLGECKHVK